MSDEKPIMLGDFEVRIFSDIDAAFGAQEEDYPPLADMPTEYQRERADGCKIAANLFYGGGKLEDFGRKLKGDVHAKSFYLALQAYLCSFAPKHEHKMATCGWLIDTCTERLT